MKITNKMVVEATPALNELTELKLPVKTAFKLAKIARQLSEVLSSYNEVLKKLQQEHVERDDEGNEISFQNENNPNVRHLQFRDPEAFYKAHNELLSVESEIDLEPLPIDELGNVEVKPSTLYELDWLFT